jgi:hypothetical protein
MRMLMKVSVPVDGGNKAIKDGTLGKILGETMERIRPEAAYFGIEAGKRTAYFVFDLKDPTEIPSIGEPIFMGFNATIEMGPVMNPQELKAGLDAWQKHS